MAEQPTKLPQWATNASTTVEPSAGEKGTGWQAGYKPPARKMNWLLNNIYTWTQYLQTPVGTGAGAGISATGGATDGAGLLGIGGGTNGDGVQGVGGGTGSGVKAIHSSAATNTVGLGGEIKGLTSGNMASGFGVSLKFILEDDTSGELEFASIKAIRAGTDGTENLFIDTGAGGQGIFIDHQGYVGIGTYSVGDTLNAELEVRGNAYPQAGNSYDLGDATNTWRRIYFADFLDMGGGYFLGEERADVAAPAANHGVIYFRDTGGKTELVARFPTDAIQQIAIEP